MPIRGAILEVNNARAIIDDHDHALASSIWRPTRFPEARFFFSAPDILESQNSHAKKIESTLLKGSLRVLSELSKSRAETKLMEDYAAGSAKEPQK